MKTLEEQPANATHWSTRSMAAATGMSQSAVSRTWRVFGLKPQQTEAFRLFRDPQFIDKVRDILGIYLNPPEAPVVLCVDEKAQALDRTAPVLPLLPGVAERRSHDYVRNGTTNLYAALDFASAEGDRGDDAAASRRGSSAAFSTASTPRCSHISGFTSCRQLLDAQVADDPALAARLPALHGPLHAHLQLLAQPDRALVRRADHEMDQARHAPLGPRPHRLDPHLDRQLERLAICGCGALTAAKIISETAGINRFKSPDAYARHNGTAPLPVWPSNRARHRLSRTGNRQLNAALHRIALTQLHWHPPKP